MIVTITGRDGTVETIEGDEKIVVAARVVKAMEEIMCHANGCTLEVETNCPKVMEATRKLILALSGTIDMEHSS